MLDAVVMVTTTTNNAMVRKDVEKRWRDIDYDEHSLKGGNAETTLCFRNSISVCVKTVIVYQCTNREETDETRAFEDNRE